MKILLVEDDEHKREQIASFMVLEAGHEVMEAKSFQSAKRAILNLKFDVFLLDMSMPTFDVSPNESGGRPQPFGGRELLYEMQRRGIKTKAIVITQFDRFGKGENELTLEQLNRQLNDAFPDTYLGAIAYSIKYSDWKLKLKRVLETVKP